MSTKTNNIRLISVKIVFITLIIFGTWSCKDETIQKEIIYSISYVKSGTEVLQQSKLSDNRDLIPLFVNQSGKMSDKSDLFAEFKANWYSDGLYIFCRVTDDHCFADTSNSSLSDALEILLAPRRGSTEIVQLTVFPNDKPEFSQAFMIIKDNRAPGLRNHIKIQAYATSRREESKTYYKVRIPLEGLGIRPALNSKILMQVNVNDADIKNDQFRNKVFWFLNGGSYGNSFNMYTVLFTKKVNSFPDGTSKCYIKDNDSIKLSVFSNTLINGRLNIIHNNITLVSSETIRSFPANYSIPLGQMNPDKDTIRIFINGKLISVYDLFNVSRIYQKIQAPGAFEKEIRFFEAQDRIAYPPENAILFIGSSSIKAWYNIKDYFPEKDIIHRGFGGSTSVDALFYINRIVINYKPSKIVYYEGDNDIAKGFSTEKILSEIDSFINIVHENLPSAQIFIIPPKPSYARIHLWGKYQALHTHLQQLYKQYPFVKYIDIVKPMFDENGILRRDIFVEDRLHLNEKGYQIWGKVIRNALGFQ